MGYFIGGIAAAYYSNQWDDTADDFEGSSDDNKDDYETIRDAMGAAAVSSCTVIYTSPIPAFKRTLPSTLTLPLHTCRHSASLQLLSLACWVSG